MNNSIEDEINNSKILSDSISLPMTQTQNQGQGAAFDDCSPVTSPKTNNIFNSDLVSIS
jgi:hypothetical protein